MEERPGFERARLRVGEWIVLIASVALLIDLLALPWYSLRSTFKGTSVSFGEATSATGAQAHHLIGPLVIICALLGLAVWGAQATVRGPALPVCLTAAASLLSLILTVCLLIRVAFDPPATLLHGAPGGDTIRTGIPAVVGVFLAGALFAGTWLSLRRDGIADADAPQRIDTPRLAGRPG